MQVNSGLFKLTAQGREGGVINTFQNQNSLKQSKQLIWNYFLVLSHQSVFWGASFTYPSCFRNAKDHNGTLGGREET